MKRKYIKSVITGIVALVAVLGGIWYELGELKQESVYESEQVEESVDVIQNNLDVNDIPDFSGSPYIVLNNNQPSFDLAWDGTLYEDFSMDDLGRCGAASASVCETIMPTEERGEIGSVKPSGWNQAKYDIVDGKYLYNRCHLIGYQLSGENANEKNLITGTRYLNVEGMLPFEDMIADYVHETGNTVLYRVTPIYNGDEPLARGVTMEAYSVEDNGDGVCFNVYCYNAQPGIAIDYATGESHLIK